MPREPRVQSSRGTGRTLISNARTTAASQRVRVTPHEMAHEDIAEGMDHDEYQHPPHGRGRNVPPGSPSKKDYTLLPGWSKLVASR